MAQDLSRRAAAPLLIGLLVLAALVRFVDLGAVPFWYDELWLKDVLIQPDLGSALEAGRALTHRAVPPPLYLWLHQQFSHPFGQGEFALRFYPALCGWAAVWLAYLWSVQIASRRVGLLVAAVLSVGPFFVYYSQETKQYSHDLAVTLAVLICAGRALRQPGRGAWLLFGVVTLVGALSSLPLTFLLPGVACMAWWRRRQGPWKTVATIAVVGTGLAAFSAWQSRTNLTRVQWEYWEPFFANTDSLGAWWEWQLRTTAGLVNSYISPGFGHILGPWEWVFAVVSLCLVVLGAVHLWRQDRRAWLCVLVIPILLLEVAALAGRYPLMNRLVLFLAPVPLAVGLAGLDRVFRRALQRPAGHLTLLAVLTLCQGLWVVNSQGIWSPKTGSEIQLANTVRKRFPDHDLYLHFETLPQLGFSFWPVGAAKEMQTLPDLTEDQLRTHLDQLFARSVQGCLVYVHPGDSPSIELFRYVPAGHRHVELIHQPGLEVLRFERLD